jgi:MFS family permease
LFATLISPLASELSGLATTATTALATTVASTMTHVADVAVVKVPMAMVLADVNLNPDVNDLPGGSVLQSLTNGLGGWALVLALVGLVFGAVMWALGSHTQNYHQSYSGRRAVIVSGLAALLIGAAPALVNFFFHAGTTVH